MRERAQRYPAGEPEDEIGLREAVRRAVEPVVRPIRVIQADERARQVQQLSRAIAVSDPCDPAPRVELRNWVSTVDRLNRFIIEREGVARLLHIEQQQTIDPRSACRHGGWRYRRTPVGFELAFTGNAPVTQTRIATLLVFRR